MDLDLTLLLLICIAVFVVYLCMKRGYFVLGGNGDLNPDEINQKVSQIDIEIKKLNDDVERHKLDLDNLEKEKNKLIEEKEKEINFIKGVISATEKQVRYFWMDRMNLRHRLYEMGILKIENNIS